MKVPSLWQLDFDVDEYLNRFVPQSRLYRLPQSLSWFLGYRRRSHQQPGSVLIWLWSFVGAFAGILLIAGVIKSSPALQSHGSVLIIGSFVSQPIGLGHCESIADLV